MKRILSSVLCAVMAFSLLAGAAFADAGMTNFKKSKAYTSGQFSDVSADKWYAKNVAAAFELALMDGQSANSFGSDANVKLSEAVAMAARLHSIYNTGKADFAQSTPWYQSYADYADKNNIVSKGRFADLEQFATRFQFAEIFAAALPDTALTMKNNIQAGDIPDVSLETPFEHIYKLYRAGVITGKTEQGHFYPTENIKRSEVAAIVTRMADESLRVSFTIKKDEDGTGAITGDAELLKQINLASAAILTSIDCFKNALASTGTPPLFAAYRIKTLEATQNAVLYGKEAMDFCKDKEKYADVYKELESAHLGSIEAAKLVSALATDSPTPLWNRTSTALQGSGNAFVRAEAALRNVK